MEPHGDRLNVFEVFTSLQGETTEAGFPCLFIRLAGCPLGCVWCDTAAARDPRSGTERSVAELLQQAAHSPFGRVLVTGGEPLAQAATPRLLAGLLELKQRVSLETGGAHCLAAIPTAVRCIIDWKPPSARAALPFLQENLARLRPDDEMKIVLAEAADLDFALEMDRRHDLARRCLFGVSPTPDFLACHPELPARILAAGRDIRINYQLHKHFFRDPATRQEGMISQS